MKCGIYMSLLVLFVLFCRMGIAQGIQNSADLVSAPFKKSFDEITNMLDGKQPLSFKRAVFLVENAYCGDSLNYGIFNLQIDIYVRLTRAFMKVNRLKDYKDSDSITENTNAAIFKVFTDTIKDQRGRIISLPFSYNFQDALGSKRYQDVFVSTLLNKKTGNCRSLPYLYKILTEEWGTKSYLALAPMHIYIKQRNKHVGWYNVELTSGHYPKDAYLISTGYISQDNIRSGFYMDTLSLRESVALCLMDLCQAYHNRVGSNVDYSFEMACADKSLEIKPNLIDGLLKKQAICKLLWKKYERENNTELAMTNKKQYIDANATLIKLDYRDIPQETFDKWYLAYFKDKSKYDNSEVNVNFKPVAK